MDTAQLFFNVFNFQEMQIKKKRDTQLKALNLKMEDL
jgi:hypothetical protein